MSERAAVLPPTEQWYAPASNGVGYVLLDPVSRERLNPNVVPSYIINDPDLKAGIGYLGAHRDDVRVTIWYGTHDKSEDLGDPAKGRFEEQVRSADYYGYEGIGTTRAKSRSNALTASKILAASLSVGRDVDAYIQTARQGGIVREISDFILRIERAMAISGTLSFCYDIAHDGGDTQRRIHKLYYENLHLPTTNETAVGYLALNNAREWCMVANTGLALHRAELGKDPRSLNTLLTLGANHRDVTRKFQHLGTTVLPKLVRVSKEYIGVTNFPQIFSSGIVLPEDLPVALYLHQQNK